MSRKGKVITGLDRPRGFQEIVAPRFHDNRYMKVVRLSALRTGRLYPQEMFNRNECQKYFLEGKGGRCVGLTTLPPSCADCHEIWEPQSPGNQRVCPTLNKDCITLCVFFTANITILSAYLVNMPNRLDIMFKS